MKIREFLKWLEEWDRQLEIDDIDLRTAMDEELGYKIILTRLEDE